MSYWWYLLSVMIYEFPQLGYKLTGLSFTQSILRIQKWFIGQKN